MLNFKKNRFDFADRKITTMFFCGALFHLCEEIERKNSGIKKREKKFDEMDDDEEEEAKEKKRKKHRSIPEQY